MPADSDDDGWDRSKKKKKKKLYLLVSKTGFEFIRQPLVTAGLDDPKNRHVRQFI